MQAGDKVFQAVGGLFHTDESVSWWIDEGIVTEMRSSDGTRLVSLHGNVVFVQLSERWKTSRAQALADVHAKLAANAAKVALRYAAKMNEVEAAIDDAQRDAALAIAAEVARA